MNLHLEAAQWVIITENQATHHGHCVPAEPSGLPDPTRERTLLHRAISLLILYGNHAGVPQGTQPDNWANEGDEERSTRGTL